MALGVTPTRSAGSTAANGGRGGRDGLGVVITAPDAAVLQEKITADYGRCPVPRATADPPLSL